MTRIHDARLSRRAALAALGAGAATITIATSPLAEAASWFPADRSWPLPAHDLSGSRSAPVRLGSVAERWRAHLAGGITGAPLVQGRSVYAASFEGDVGAFDLDSGEQRWLRPLGTAGYGTGADARELGFFGGVALQGDRLIVASDHAIDSRVATCAAFRTPRSRDPSLSYRPFEKARRTFRKSGTLQRFPRSFFTRIGHESRTCLAMLPSPSYAGRGRLRRVFRIRGLGFRLEPHRARRVVRTVTVYRARREPVDLRKEISRCVDVVPCFPSPVSA